MSSYDITARDTAVRRADDAAAWADANPGSAAESAASARRSQLIFIYGSGLGIGLQSSLWNFTLMRSLPSAAFIIVATLVYSMLTQLLWERVLPRFDALPTGKRLGAQAAVSALAYTALSVALTEVRALLLSEPSVLFPYGGPDIAVTIPAYALRQAPLVFTLIPIVPTVIICVVGFNQYWWRLRRLHNRQEELRNLAISAQLAALRAQVNPHFLFNSLNSIAQLIATDPVKAEACVERLGDIYRYLLHRAQADFVPLAEELRVAESYLEIERARFGDALRVEEHIDARARAQLLPSLILQPLVENAVKHGISPKIGGGQVTIEAHVDERDLHLAVKDTGVGLRDERAIFDSGVGLRNVRDRLLRLYGAAYVPVVASRPGDGTTVSLRIPLTTGAA
ncbi:MAG: sensor histidine kinase [Candidatus Binatia bacterium]